MFEKKGDTFLKRGNIFEKGDQGPLLQSFTGQPQDRWRSSFELRLPSKFKFEFHPDPALADSASGAPLHPSFG